MKALVLCLIPLFAQAGRVDYGPMQVKSWTNPDCLGAKSCELREFKISSRPWRAEFSNPQGPAEYSFGDTAYLEYLTDRPENLEKYVIVQFIRGCQFSSQQDSSGQVLRSSHIVRQLYDEYYLFHHPEWTIDSLDTDPMYNSSQQGARHSYYRWTPDGVSYEGKSEKRLSEGLPTSGRLYVSDRPGTAFVSGGVAKNISLDFQACIYRASDVPTKSVGPEDVLPGALHCLSWNSHWEFNHSLGVYENPSDISPYCALEPNAGRPVRRVPGGWTYL